jgi:hypothetical protein
MDGKKDVRRRTSDVRIRAKLKGFKRAKRRARIVTTAA